MGSYTEIIDLFMGAAGVYMLYSAVTGRGSLFNMENVKKGLEETFLKYLKLFCWVGGVLAVGNALLDYFRIEPYATITYIILAVFIVAFAVFYAKFTAPKK